MANTISSNSSSIAAQQRQAEQARQAEAQRQAEQARQAQQAQQAQQQSQSQEQSEDTKVGAKSPAAQSYHRDSYDPQPQVTQPQVTQPAPGSGETGPQDAGSGDVTASRQTTQNGCGPTSVIQLAQAANSHLSTAQATQDVANSIGKANGSSAIQDRGGQVDLKNGTTPSEMAVLLGEQGQRVLRGFDNYDAGYLKDAITDKNSDKKALALVDSNALAHPDDKNAAPGPLHWVTIDSVNKGNTPSNPDDDKFEVSDPATGTKYSVTEQQLKGATEKAREQSGTGGVLVVQNDPNVTTDAQREQLALDNINNSALLGDDNGGQGRNSANLSGGY